MLDLKPLQRTTATDARPSCSPSMPTSDALVAGWRENLAIINMRGPADNALFRRAIAEALGVELPVQACTTTSSNVLRVVWVGPDEWFVIATNGQASILAARLQSVLAGLHHAVTDVSSGYTVMHMSGKPLREVLAAGCPLDLHPRAFHMGSSAGSHFFQTSIWLWQVDDAPTFELLVRRSFMGYFWLMLERSSRECGLLTWQYASIPPGG